MNYPTDPQAEMGALGTLIETAGKDAALLTPDLFATDAGMRLYEVIRGLLSAGAALSITSTARSCPEELVRSAVDQIGPGISYWLPILREKRALRLVQAITAGLNTGIQKLNQERRPVEDDVRELVTKTSSDLMAVLREVGNDRRPTMQQNLLELYESMEACDRGERPPTIPTGLPTIDKCLRGGLRYGEMTVVAARTSGGKSALACWIAKSACEAGKTVLYASREMNVKGLTARIQSAVAGVPVSEYEGIKHFSDAERKAVLNAGSRMKDWKLIIRRDLRTLLAVRAEVAAVKPDLLVIDHLGIFDSGLDERRSTFDKATHNSNLARDMALDDNIAVLALVQVNRAGAESDAPELHHLKSTGAIEEDARAVMLLHLIREVSSEVNILQLNLAKNTYKNLRVQPIRFDKARCLFHEEYDINP